MLKQVQELFHFGLQAKDGEIGRCKDFLFDDQHWTIRYMVADTGGWLSDKKVLISPISLKKPLWDEKLFPVNLKKKQIVESPSLDSESPVSRQYEKEYSGFYRYPLYWNGAGVWGATGYPSLIYDENHVDEAEEEWSHGEPSAEKTHLRSMREVMGYGVQSSSGRFGHVEDFIIDDESWSVLYLVVDTGHLFPSQRVLVPMETVGGVDWFEKVVSIKLPKEVIKKSPIFDAKRPLVDDYRHEVDRYYHLEW